MAACIKQHFVLSNTCIKQHFELKKSVAYKKSVYLANLNSNVLLNAIMCDAYHCQHILINQYISI